MDAEGEYDYLFKLVVVGDSGVGKSVLILRYTTNQFAEHTKATIGVNFGHKTIKKDDELIQAQLWDTAGQERFRSITPGFYRGAQGAVLVYSITDRKSFDSLSSWLGEIQRQSDCLIVLVGNKCDLEDQREVSTAEAKAFAEKHSLYFLETSAKTAENVDKAFEYLINEIHNKAKAGKSLEGEEEQESTSNLSQGAVKLSPPSSEAANSEQPTQDSCRC